VGKTLLLRAIVDLDPHQGEVWLDGIESRSVPPAQWRRRVGLLAADSPWWHATVGEHFAHVSIEELAALGFGHEVLQWQVSRLSSGERQRLALLRLLSRRPQALLLDEPTANLDPESTRRVETLVTQLRNRQSIPVLWVTHDREQGARIASRHLHLAAGGRLEER
jgi:ABC-type iron transport system FetAB ATPase subunit